MSTEFHDLSDSPADLVRFHRFFEELYVPGFPDEDERESPENMLNYLRLRSTGWYGTNNYHILLLEENERPVGAAVIDYLAVPNTGFIEFLIVAEDCRGRGLGSRLLAKTEKVLMSDARRNHDSKLAAIIIELNDPFRTSANKDNFDPFKRVLVWDNWGFRRLEFPYVQPALSDEQKPVHGLILAVKPLSDQLQSSLPSELVRQSLFGYLKWAMRIEAPDENLTFQSMLNYLADRETVPLTPLREYIGHDPRKSFDVVPITSVADSEFEPLIRVYEETFPASPVAVESSAFGDALKRNESLTRRGVHFHLWGIRESPTTPIAGMASFFTLKSFGFAGYLAWLPSLRGTGRTRLLMARMEEQMIRDENAVSGWYLECDPNSVAAEVFLKTGFRQLAVQYHQPSLKSADGKRAARSLGPEQWLLYKRLGADYGLTPPPNEQILADVATILQDVYQVTDPESSPTLQIAKLSLDSRKNELDNAAID